MIIGTTIKNFVGLPSLNLRPYEDKYISCKWRAKNCTMSLDVEEMVKKGNMKNSECILWGFCVDSCKKDAINYYFGK